MQSLGTQKTQATDIIFVLDYMRHVNEVQASEMVDHTLVERRPQKSAQLHWVANMGILGQ